MGKPALPANTDFEFEGFILKRRVEIHKFIEILNVDVMNIFYIAAS